MIAPGTSPALADAESGADIGSFREEIAFREKPQPLENELQRQQLTTPTKQDRCRTGPRLARDVWGAQAARKPADFGKNPNSTTHCRGFAD
jgi:hypothetical protein